MTSRAKGTARPLPRDMGAIQAKDDGMGAEGHSARLIEANAFQAWAPPLPWWHREQELLRDRWAWLEGAILGSNHASVVAAIEGARGGAAPVNLEADLIDAYRHDTRSRRLRAARMIARVDRALARITEEHAAQLRALYASPVHRGLDAFGLACNLIPWSPVAASEYRAARSRASMGEWLVRLSARVSPGAVEQRAIQRIRGDLSEIGHRALAAFVAADRRVRVGRR